MSRRVELPVCLWAATLVVVARAIPFMAPGVRLDADQAVVGLMAKHISEGRAFPVFSYGQSYLLALEAYLAAPFMWLLGPTKIALKMPILVMNVGATLLLIWLASRDLGLRPLTAAACALPIALPPSVVGTRLMEAMGGNAELPLLRAAPVDGARAHVDLRAGRRDGVRASGTGHRSAGRAARTRGASRRLVVPAGGRSLDGDGRAAAAVQGVVGALRPFGQMFGPGSSTRPADLDISSASAIGAQLWVDPSRWADRFHALVTERLPLLVGGTPGPLNLAGVSTGVGHGHAGLAPWVAALVCAGLALGAARASRARAGERAVPHPDVLPTDLG